MIKYPHLHLIDWPFRVVPDESFYSLMADRTQLVSDIKTLLRNFSVRPISSIHLMWAWFGAGKTHTLRHIEHLCRTSHSNLLPIYIEFPRGTKSFLDLYKSFISKIDMDKIDEYYLDIFGDRTKEKIQKDLSNESLDMANALKMHFVGTEDQKQVVTRYLRVECRELRVLKSIGVTRPIQSSEDAIKSISWLIHLICSGSSSVDDTQRIIWMIDEFQRIEGCRKPTQEDVSSCLHAVFNKCPNSLSIIISFSGYPQKKMPYWLSSELKDRIGIEKPLLLPPLSSEEAYEFSKDVTLPRLLYHYILEYPALIDSASTGMPVEKFSVSCLINSSGVRYPSELCGLSVL